MLWSSYLTVQILVTKRQLTQLFIKQSLCFCISRRHFGLNIGLLYLQAAMTNIHRGKMCNSHDIIKTGMYASIQTLVSAV